MENSEKAKAIVELCRRMVRESTTHFIRAEAELASAEKGHEMWEEEENRIGSLGSFQRDPYNVEVCRDRRDDEHIKKEYWQEVLDYAIEVFLGKIV